jgi:hypothetical protein
VYGWIWRHLPGGTSSKVLLSVLLVLVFVAWLFLGVFPWLDARLATDSVTVGP